MKAWMLSSDSGCSAAFARSGLAGFQSAPRVSRKLQKRSTMTDHEPLEEPTGTPSGKSQTIGIAWRANSWRGHCATGSHRQNEFPRSASLPRQSPRQVRTACASVASGSSRPTSVIIRAYVVSASAWRELNRSPNVSAPIRVTADNPRALGDGRSVGMRSSGTRLGDPPQQSLLLFSSRVADRNAVLSRSVGRR